MHFYIVFSITNFSEIYLPFLCGASAWIACVLCSLRLVLFGSIHSWPLHLDNNLKIGSSCFPSELCRYLLSFVMREISSPVHKFYASLSLKLNHFSKICLNYISLYFYRWSHSCIVWVFWKSLCYIFYCIFPPKYFKVWQLKIHKMTFLFISCPILVSL